ncbi:MAG: phosphotransferase enzyme family protein [Pseudonocardiaceae bacterium]
MSTVNQHPTGDIDRLTGVLRTHYDLHAQEITRLRIGQGTLNYRVTTAEQTVFVKHYPPGTDLDAERAGIAMSCLAGRAGVPVASPRASAGGAVLADQDGVAVSVWDFVPGATITGGFTRAQLIATGMALGRVHRAFAQQPARSEVSETGEWLAFDPGPALATVDTLLGTVAQRRRGGLAEEFDAAAERSLIQRRDQLPRVAGLLAGLPELSSQVLHGDYSAVNLLFDGDRLTAVLDFCPPEAFLVAWELGRIAFDPRTVVLDPGWLDSAQVLVAAYLTENPPVWPADIACCGRVALIQLIRSLYGVTQHYQGHGLLQDDLDRFWLLRHQAATTLLAHLSTAEAALGELSAQTRPPTVAGLGASGDPR